MATLNHVLAERQHRLKAGQKRQHFAVSVIGHTLLVTAFFLIPKLWAEEPEPFEFVTLNVVPPKALGIDQPTPTPEPEPQQQEAPPPPAPKPEPKPERPVLVEEKKAPTPPPPKPPPPRPTPQPVKPALQPAKPAPVVPKRQGSPFGNPLGASTTEATLGVEDPNFTYGYYLDLIVGRISSEWTRPAVGGDVINARLFFRIEKDGTVKDLAVQKTSGDRSFDEAALAAVRKAAPLPPLPKGYKREFLGINLTVK